MLNTEQQEAVTHTQGPLMIIAGAGTGKTKVLTHRIFNLIESKSARPEEILALTFTEKAANEIQERLDLLLPYGYQELCVKTFHGFSDSILRESGLSLGLDTHYQLLSQNDLALFLRENLFSFELEIYRPLGNPLRFIQSLISHFNQLRDEMIDPKMYLDYAEKQLEYSEAEEDREAARQTLELAKAYQHYGELLIRMSKMDFASLNFLALKLFQKNPSILRHYQEKFKYLLVDEFQDTNTVQRFLVETLADRHRNIMVVGDDDQCIYKWRGASLSNIFHFQSRFPEAKQVILNQNYRSTQGILDMSHAVIQNNNPFRLEAKENIDKRLKSNSSEEIASPSIVSFEHYSKEVDFVLNTIEEAIQKQSAQPKEFAILVRAGNHAVPFLEELKRRGIPYDFSGAQGLFQREEIKDLLAVLRSSIHPFDDIALFRVLTLPVFKIDISQVLEWVHEAKSSSKPLLKILQKHEKSPDLFSSLESPGSVQNFLKQFQALQAMSSLHQTSAILGLFLKQSGYLKNLQDHPSLENEEKIKHLGLFSQIIHEFEENHPEGGILDCLDYLQARFEMGDRGTILDFTMDNNTVKILTIHAAKGLEFETVFIVNLVQQRFPSTARREGFEIPTALLSEELTEELPHILEERRLFYVACTRAKKHLYLTHSERYEGKKRWKPSIFIQEALDSGHAQHLEPKTTSSEQESPFKIIETPPTFPTPILYQRSHRPLRLSFSRIDTFQCCPLKYKFRYLYQIAEPMGHAASFGSSLHNTLNQFYQRLMKGEKPSLSLLKELYESCWISLGYESSHHQKLRKKEGWEMLEAYFHNQTEPWKLPKYLEKPFTLKTDSGWIISGRIDRIDALEDGTFEVIDYKTGKMKTQKEVDADLQLSIYALACRDILKLPVSKLSLYYLREQQKVTTSRSPEKLKKTELELTEIVETMESSEFKATPSPIVCSFCEYRLLCDKAA